MLKKIFALILFFTSAIPSVFATHERAGFITYTHISGLTYLVTIVTYTRTSSPADRPVLDSVHFGDGDTGVFIRQYKDSVAPDISINFYQDYHTYPGAGIYTISFEDPNRNADVVNIPNSVNVPFYVESQLTIGSTVSYDHSPVLTQPPIDFGCTNRLFIYNPGAYDADGDSLSYNLSVCKGAGGQDIPGYTFPNNYATVTFSLNPVTGDMIWQDPNTTGAFNVAFEVHEWRKINDLPTDIGYVKCDMQIYIGTCTNLPPVIDSIPPLCVLAGDTATFTACASDPDGNHVDLSAFGSTFTFSPDASNFVQNTFNKDTVCGTYSWITSCGRVRTDPYDVIIKATEIVTPGDTPLVDLRQVGIRVVGPPPLNPVATATNNSIILNWQQSVCAPANNILGYKVYRRNGMYPGSIPCPCINGVPAYTGYSYLAYVSGVDSTHYVDSSSLAPGIDYCYLITAIYNTEDSTQSCASVQACAYLKKDLPVITNASVTTTDVADGAIYVAWSRPADFDSTRELPPYMYIVYRASDSSASSFVRIDTLNDINDTIVIDTLINTVAHQYSYKIEFYYTDSSSGRTLLAGTTQTASSVYLKIHPTDKELDLSWQDNVPWTNDSFIVFRQNNGTGPFLPVDTTTLNIYADKGLINGNHYTYYIESIGHYSAPGLIDPIINLSQRVDTVPIDNVPPCKPALNVIPDCINSNNQLIWDDPNNSCLPDSQGCVGYQVWYYTPVETDPVLIATITNPNDTTYIHSNLASNTGCYSIVAIDSVGNKSPLQPFTCIDSCHQYYLPNVFSPDGDGHNDVFHPCDQTTAPQEQKVCPPYKNVKDVVMKIYNRWGNLVFETTDRDIDWDGTDEHSHQACPDGVYYYICEVHEIYLQGIRSHTITGFVEIIRKH